MKTFTIKFFFLILITSFLSSLATAGSKRRGPVTITPDSNGGYSITDIIDIPTHVDKLPSAPITRNIPAGRMLDLVDHAKRVNPMTVTITLAATAAAAAAGYAIDELTNQISTISITAEKEWRVEYAGNNYYDSTADGACSKAGSAIGESWSSTEPASNVFSASCMHENGYQTRVASATIKDKTTYSPLPHEQQVDLINDEIFKQNLPASDYSDLFNDPSGNSYWTPERMDAFDDFWRNYGQTNSNDQTDVTYDHDAQTNKRTISIVDKLTGQGEIIDISPEDTVDDPTTSGTDTGQTSFPGDSTITPTTPDITNPTETTPQNSTGTTTTTSTGSTTSTQWPTFCGWATKVCDFIDWVTEPAPLPVVPPPTGIYDALPSDLSELPTLDTPVMPDFLPSKSDCETITLTVTTFYGTNESQIFPTPEQCAKLKQGQTLVGWFLYVITWFGVVYIIMGHRGGNAQ